VSESPILNRAARKLLRQLEEAESETPFTIWLRLGDRLSFWFSRDEIDAAIQAAATKALERLRRQPISPGRVLASQDSPAKLRSQAARAMLAMRGGRATATKMRALGYPNLTKAREVRRRKAMERRTIADPQ
jgi:hypothetical protein